MHQPGENPEFPETAPFFALFALFCQIYWYISDNFEQSRFFVRCSREKKNIADPAPHADPGRARLRRRIFIFIGGRLREMRQREAHFSNGAPFFFRGAGGWSPTRRKQIGEGAPLTFSLAEKPVPRLAFSKRL